MDDGSITFGTFILYDSDLILLDAEFIAETTEVCSRSRELQIPERRPTGRMKAFSWTKAERNLVIKFLPPTFSRSKENKSRSYKNDDGGHRIDWTIELRYYGTEVLDDRMEMLEQKPSSTETFHNIPESKSLLDLIENISASSLFYVLDESPKTDGATGKCHKSFPVDPTKSFKDILQNLTLIEFPTFLVVTSK
jgi:hypothetical protein